MSDAAGRAPGARTRLLTEDDLPQVASLFQAVFRNGRSLHRPDLIAAMRDLYLRGPSFEADLASVVHVGRDGVINGFMGMQPMRLRWGERTLRARVMSSFMVADPARNPTVAHRMITAFMAGPHDLVVSDTTNLTSLRLAERMGFKLPPDSGLQWTCVLRPAGFAREAARGRAPSALLRLGVLPARLLDAGAGRFRPHADPASRDEPVDADAFAAAAEALAQAFAIRPDWRHGGLHWQLGLAATKRDAGHLDLRTVRDGAGRLNGAYAYFHAPRGIGTVVHILAQPGAAAVVIASLCREAYANGCVAVRGQTQPALMPGLFRTKNVFLRHVDATIVHARDPALMAAVMGGEAMLGGLVGDSWTRLASDGFA